MLADDDAILTRTIDLEGGYQCDPDDTGNRNAAGVLVGTNAGITPADFERFYGHIPSADDMRTLAPADIRVMYRLFYLAPWSFVADLDLKGELFDFGVVCGVPTALRALQSVLRVPVDGVAGPRTATALRAVTDPLAFERDLSVERIERYVDAILARPAKRKYLTGWLRRALLVDPS